MRIIIVSYLHPSVAPGGAQQVAYELYQASLGQGHDSYFVAAMEDQHEATYGKPGAPIVPVPGAPREYFYFPQHYDFVHHSVGDWRSTSFFGDLLSRLKPDVVHFHHYHRVGVEAIRAARNAAPSAVICLTFHEMMAICMADGQMLKRGSRELCVAAGPIPCNQCFPDLRPEFIILREKRLKAILGECDHFLFPSQFLAERYVTWGLQPDKCSVISNGLTNLDVGFDRTWHSRSVNRFGFFGQFIDNKGVDVVLDAVLILANERRLPQQGVVIEINGGNQHYATPAYLERVNGQVERIRKLQTGRIEIRRRGLYTREQLADRMRLVDWVLVPSTWWEIFGLVVSEAWMFGRPVIASAIGGLKERIEPDVNGLTFAARDARALADIIAELVGDEQRWIQINQRIEQPDTELDMLAGHEAVWQELMTNKSIASSTQAANLGSADGVPGDAVVPGKRKKDTPRRRDKSGQTSP